MTIYRCGIYRISGNYRFGDAYGNVGGPYSEVHQCREVEVVPGGSPDEYYVFPVTCNGNRPIITNGISGSQASSFNLEKIGDCPCESQPSYAGDGYPCGIYEVSGTYRYNSSGASGAAFSTVISGAGFKLDAGGSSDEFYLNHIDCDGTRNLLNNGYSGVKASDLKIKRIGDCPCEQNDNCSACCKELTAIARSITP